MSAIYAYNEKNRKEKKLAKQISIQRAAEEIVKVRRAAARIRWKDDERKIADAFERAWEDESILNPPQIDPIGPTKLTWCRCGKVGGHVNPCPPVRVEAAPALVFGKNSGVGAKNSRNRGHNGPPIKPVPSRKLDTNTQWRPWQSRLRALRRGFRSEPTNSYSGAKNHWRPWQG
jgi:hypothetical protein